VRGLRLGNEEDFIMDFYHEINVVLSESPGKDKQWQVTAEDFKQPLASFDNPQAACAWAIAQAKFQGGKVLIEELETITSASVHEDMNTPPMSKYSIPVVWTESGYSRFKYTRSQRQLSGSVEQS
jgi:hypothetical protein